VTVYRKTLEPATLAASGTVTFAIAAAGTHEVIPVERAAIGVREVLDLVSTAVRLIDLVPRVWHLLEHVADWIADRLPPWP
jgi:hypothetical protein